MNSSPVYQSPHARQNTTGPEAAPYEWRHAIVSACGLYRYALERLWDIDLPPVLFVMLNPSTADGRQDDPTIRKCYGFAKRWGHGRFGVANLFAYRATDPAALRGMAPAMAIGPDNDRAIELLAKQCGRVVVAWGTSGELYGRAPAVLKTLRGIAHAFGFRRGIECLGTTKDGHPRHPLYVPYTVKPVLF